VVLDAQQPVEGTIGRDVGAGGLKPPAHHPMQDRRHEADRRVRANPFRQAVIDRSDLQLGLQHPEATFDIGERLVAGDDSLSVEIRCVRDEQKLAVHHLRELACALIDVVAEQIRFRFTLMICDK